MRAFSDKFVDGEIAKIDALKERIDSEYPTLPELRYDWERESLKLCLNHRGKQSYITGFWYGWSLCLGHLANEINTLKKRVEELESNL